MTNISLPFYPISFTEETVFSPGLSLEGGERGPPHLGPRREKPGQQTVQNAHSPSSRQGDADSSHRDGSHLSGWPEAQMLNGH